MMKSRFLIASAALAVLAVPFATSQLIAQGEMAAAAQKQNADNAAAKAAYDQAVRDREALIAKQKADYDAAMVKWEADSAACKAGDRSKCAAPK